MKNIYDYRSAIVLCALAVCGVTASASTLPFSTAGWYSSVGTTDRPGSNNYFAGLAGGDFFRNFFTFNLTGLSGTYSAATLTITNRQDTVPATSPNSSDTYDVYMTNATAAALNAGTAGYANVVTGSAVGGISTNFNTLTNGQQLVLSLNSAELAAINALIGTGTLSIGGQVTTATTGSDYLFVGAGGGSTQPQAGDVFLTLTPGTSGVPEPTTMALIGTALLGLGAIRFRRKV